MRTFAHRWGERSTAAREKENKGVVLRIDVILLSLGDVRGCGWGKVGSTWRNAGIWVRD
jgi:hypothetical protein